MTIKKFIESAIEGGWDSEKTLMFGVPIVEKKIKIFGGLTHQENCVVLLDPLAWQAVGKVEGWDKWMCSNCRSTHNATGSIICPECNNQGAYKTWWGRMYCMIDALAEGKSVEQYIQTL